MLEIKNMAAAYRGKLEVLMKKATLIALLIVFILFACSAFMGADGKATTEENNVAVVKRVLEVVKTRDVAVLDQVMQPHMITKFKPVLEKLWAKEKNIETFISEIFAKEERVAVGFSLMGMDDSCRGQLWSVNFVSIWYVMKGKVAGIESGNKFLGDLFEKDFTLKPTKTLDFKGKWKWTMGDMKSISNAVKHYKGKMPELDSIRGLTKVIAPDYMRIVPLKDQWGNDFLFKSQGQNYWLASSGSDGTFKGFDRQGTWDTGTDKGEDIVLHNDEFVFGPDIEAPWKTKKPETFEEKVFATMSEMKTTSVAIFVYQKYNDKKAPQVNSFSELRALLVPHYVRYLNEEDGWGNEFIYTFDKDNPQNYWIASGGSDGKVKGLNQSGKTAVTDTGQDIILHNGKFTFYPEISALKEK